MEEKNNIFKNPKTFKNQQLFLIWNNFAAAGSADKDKMVTIASWILGLSVAADGYLMSKWAHMFHGAIEFFVIPLVVMLACLVTLFVVFVYAGYSNRNWAKANELARCAGVEVLLLDNEAPELKDDSLRFLTRLALRMSKRLSKPYDARTGMAPVFWLFLVLAIALFVTNLFLFSMAFLSAIYKLIS